MSAKPRRHRGAHRRGVRRIVAMEIVSGLGDGAFWVSLTAVLFDRGAGPGMFALAALARLGPRALISAPAGVIADQVDRRRLLATLDAARAALMATLALSVAQGAPTTALLTLVLATYVLAAPYRPALTAAMPLVAGESGLSAANALVGTVRQLMTFVGPLCGAVLLKLGSATIGFSMNAVTFLISAGLMASLSELTTQARSLSMQVMLDERHHWVDDMAQGWAEVRRHGGLLTITVLVFAMYTARGAEIPLHILVADRQLGLGAGGIGVLAGAIAFGALATLPLSDRIANTRHPATTMASSVAASAVGLAVLAPLRSPVAACAVLIVVGAALVVFEVLSIVLLQRLAKLSTLGRVFGIVNSASNAGKLTGALAAPAAVTIFGLSNTLIVAGAAIGTATVLNLPGLRRLSRTVSERREHLRPMVESLRSLALFERASAAALERVASSIDVESIAPDQVVIAQGDAADDLFIIRSGQFRVLDGDAEINRMTEGDWFGEIGLLQNRPRSASVVATSPATVWRIPGDVFLLALNDQAAPPTALIDAMSDRLARSAAIDRPGASGSGSRQSIS